MPAICRSMSRVGFADKRSLLALDICHSQDPFVSGLVIPDRLPPGEGGVVWRGRAPTKVLIELLPKVNLSWGEPI